MIKKETLQYIQVEATGGTVRANMENASGLQGPASAKTDVCYLEL